MDMMFAMFTFMMIAINMGTFFVVSNRFENRFYDTLMMKSGAPFTYLFTRYLKDILLHVWALLCIALIPLAFNLSFDGIALPGILWALSNPLFIYAFSYHFVRDRRVNSNILGGVFILLSSFILIYIDLALAIGFLNLTYYKVVLIISIFFIWMPSFNFLMSIIFVCQAGNVSKMHGESFNDVSKIGPYGAELWILALVVCLLFYGVWLLLCVFDFCIKKPSASDL